MGIPDKLFDAAGNVWERQGGGGGLGCLLLVLFPVLLVLVVLWTAAIVIVNGMIGGLFTLPYTALFVLAVALPMRAWNRRQRDRIASGHEPRVWRSRGLLAALILGAFFVSFYLMAYTTPWYGAFANAVYWEPGEGLLPAPWEGLTFSGMAAQVIAAIVLARRFRPGNAFAGASVHRRETSSPRPPASYSASSMRPTRERQMPTELPRQREAAPPPVVAPSPPTPPVEPEPVVTSADSASPKEAVAPDASEATQEPADEKPVDPGPRFRRIG